MRIRKATSLDKGDIRRIYLSAFPENERDLVADVAIQLLVEEEAEPRHGAFSLVAEEADDENNDVKTIVGHVAFSKVRNERDKKKLWVLYWRLSPCIQITKGKASGPVW